MMKMISLAALALCCAACGGGNKAANEQKAEEPAAPQAGQATVYFTKDISPESLVPLFFCTAIPYSGIAICCSYLLAPRILCREE